MNVLFDSDIFAAQRVGGISRYFVELAIELARLEGVSAGVLAPLHINQFLAESGATKVAFSLESSWLNHRVRSPLNQATAAFFLKFLAPDVLHTTYYFKAKRPSKAKALVVTVHDMIHELYPADFPLGDKTAKLKRQAVEAADHIICVSENTRRDLCDILCIDRAKTTVVYHGVSARFLGGASKMHATRPYLLFVGHRGGYKNFDTLLRAVAGCASLKSEFDIIAFGGAGFSPDEINAIRDLDLATGAVKHLTGGDDLLGTLYLNAACFVYPSLYEGFGMPLLEAMTVGCPVVSANSSCLPEVAGNSAQYFEPESPEDLASAILKVVGSSSYSSWLSAQGKARAEEFTWRRTALETLMVYKSLV